MAELIEVDPVEVSASAQSTMSATVQGGLPGSAPIGVVASSLSDGIAATISGAIAGRGTVSSASVLPRAPEHFSETTSGLALVTSTEAGNAAKTASVVLPGGVM